MSENDGDHDAHDPGQPPDEVPPDESSAQTPSTTTEIDDLTHSMRATKLNLVPNQVRFGRRTARARP